MEFSQRLIQLNQGGLLYIAGVTYYGLPKILHLFL